MSKRNLLFWLPNFTTAMNLVSGVMAVILGVEGELGAAAILILAAAVFDFLDGMFARLVHSYSEIGKQLDSLADLVSFGVAPAAVLMSMMELSLLGKNVPVAEMPFGSGIFIFLGLLVPVAGAFRLAKFNIDTRQTESFLGLPIPANAMFHASLAVIIAYGEIDPVKVFILSPWFLAGSVLVFSWLMISEIPMFSLKVKNLKWQGNQVRFLFLGLCVILFAAFRLHSLPLIMLSYILVSVLSPRSKKNTPAN